MVRSGIVRDADTATKLWIHEVSRVFHDRLINDEDRDWFKDYVCDLLGRQFKSRWQRKDVFDEGKILFGDLLRIDSDVREYEEIKDIPKLIKVNSIDFNIFKDP
jgi:dynein heavy chain